MDGKRRRMARTMDMAISVVPEAQESAVEEEVLAKDAMGGTVIARAVSSLDDVFVDSRVFQDIV